MPKFGLVGTGFANLDALGVNRSATFVGFLGSDIGLPDRDTELCLGCVDNLAQRQVGRIDRPRSVEVPQEHFNLTNCNLSHTLLTHRGDGSFPMRHRLSPAPKG